MAAARVQRQPLQHLRAPRLLRLYGHVQCLMHVCRIGEGIAVGHRVRTRGINTIGLLWTVNELASYLQWDGLQ